MQGPKLPTINASPLWNVIFSPWRLPWGRKQRLEQELSYDVHNTDSGQQTCWNQSPQCRHEKENVTKKSSQDISTWDYNVQTHCFNTPPNYTTTQRKDPFKLHNARRGTTSNSKAFTDKLEYISNITFFLHCLKVATPATKPVERIKGGLDNVCQRHD